MTVPLLKVNAGIISIFTVLPDGQAREMRSAQFAGQTLGYERLTVKLNFVLNAQKIVNHEYLNFFRNYKI